MKKFFWPSLLITLLALVAAQSARGDSTVTPFVDSQTSLVIYVDFSTLDMDQVDAWQQKAMSAMPDSPQRAKQQQDTEKAITSAKKWITDFKTAGGKDLYVVISLAGLMQGAPGGLVIPLNGTDGAALAKVFNPHGNPPPANPADPNAAQQARMQPQTAVVGSAMVFSTGAGIDKMKTPSAEPRQDLNDALASGGDATVHIALNPVALKSNPLFSAIVNSRMGGQNPGGAPPQPPFSDPQWDAVTWMSLSLTAPPKEAGNCTIQCKDAGSATALSDLITKKIADGKADFISRQKMSPEDYDKLAAAVKPAVSGTQVVISLDQNTIDNVIGPMLSKSMQAQAAPPPAAGPDNSGM